MLIGTSARRKQGGSQSINDNAKSKAVSAGAMLRRYGEQALRDVSSFSLRCMLFVLNSFACVGYP